MVDQAVQTALHETSSMKITPPGQHFRAEGSPIHAPAKASLPAIAYILQRSMPTESTSYANALALAPPS
jgi:hypothetical protein